MAPWEKYQQPQQPAPGMIQLSPGSPLKKRAAELGVAGQQQNLQQGVAGIEGQGLINEQKRYDIASKPVYDRFGAVDKLRDNVRQDKRIQAYETAVPIWASALRSPASPEGDTLLVNAFAKTLDPLTGVQQREGAQIAESAPSYEQVKARLLKEFGSDDSGNFTPAGRERLKKTITTRMKELATAYNASRDEWRKYIKAAKVPDTDAEVILGPHMGAGFQQAEADWLGRPVRNLDRSQGAVPTGYNERQQMGPGDIGFSGKAEPTPSLSPEQSAAYEAFWKANPNPSEQQLSSFFQGIGQKVQNAGDILKARKEGLGVRPLSEAIIKPDISDIRKGDEVLDPIGRGLADVPMMGMSEELAAGIETIGKGGTFDQNLARQNAIRDYDKENNPYLRLGGQVAGGFALPMGQMKTVPQILGKSAAYGGGYGFGATDGSFQERLGGGVLGAGAGAATAGGLLGIGRGARALMGPKTSAVPELVDPVTGRINEPLEAMSPAHRVAEAQKYGIELPLDAAGDRTAAILGKGLDILPPSAGVMNDARRVTEGQAANAVEGVANRYGAAESFYAGGQAAQRGANNWITRFDDVSAKAYNAIPISDKADAALASTRATLGELTSTFQSNPKLAEALKSPELETYQQALQTGGLSWKDLKEFRTRIGYKIGEQRFSDGPTKDQLRSLYGALSDDMRSTAAAQGPGALRKFERANNLYAQGQERIDKALVQILGDNAKNSPEAAARAIQTIAKSGKGTSNINQLRQIRSSLAKGEEWDEVASSLIRLMGQPVNSEGRQFNPITFVQNYKDMSEPARNLLFGDRGRQELRKALDGFVAVNQRLANTGALRNTSNTAPGLTAAGAVGAIGAAVGNPVLAPKIAAAWAATWGLSKLWTNPSFVRWATGYSKLVATGGSAAAKNQFGKLRKVVSQNPQIRGEVEQFMRAVNDNFTRQVAASEPENGR